MLGMRFGECTQLGFWTLQSFWHPWTRLSRLLSCDRCECPINSLSFEVAVATAEWVVLKGHTSWTIRVSPHRQEHTVTIPALQMKPRNAVNGQTPGGFSIAGATPQQSAAGGSSSSRVTSVDPAP